MRAIVFGSVGSDGRMVVVCAVSFWNHVPLNCHFLSLQKGKESDWKTTEGLYYTLLFIIIFYFFNLISSRRHTKTHTH